MAPLNLIVLIAVFVCGIANRGFSHKASVVGESQESSNINQEVLETSSRLVQLLQQLVENQVAEDEEDNSISDQDQYVYAYYPEDDFPQQSRSGIRARFCRQTTELDDEAGVITSPRYPSNYPHRLNCNWLITAPTGYNIEITVSDFAIQSSPRCRADALEVFDGVSSSSPSQAKLCGDDVQSETIVTGNVALVHFRSNRGRNDRGFELTYRRVAVEETDGQDGCSGITTVTSSSGEHTSPGYPGELYPNDVTCGWLITAPSGQVVHLVINFLSLEDGPNCGYDSLEIIDGSGEDAPTLAKLCGTSADPPAEFTSAGHVLVVLFASDYAGQDQGFNFTWSFETPEVVTLPPIDLSTVPGCSGEPAELATQEGSFSSPGYEEYQHYPMFANCSWRITVEEDMRVHVHFEDFAMEENDNCQYDKLRLYDGYDISAPELGTYCGNDIPGDITASGHVMLVLLQSDDTVEGLGFLALYSAKRSMETDGTLGTGVTCGIPEVEPRFQRIVGGVEAAPHSWPWQISLRYRNPPSTEFAHACGGSIISPDWIVSASHCVHNYGGPADFRVVVGDHNRITVDDVEETVEVANIIEHPEYDPHTEDHDIALLQLARPLSFRREIIPVCLPSVDVSDDALCVTTGWGETYGTADNSVLQQIRLPIIDQETCNRHDWHRGRITDNMFCAGYAEGGRDSCQGDSGGPLVCRTGGSYKLQGITSWGTFCAMEQEPGVYTRVTRFLDWIEAHTGVIAAPTATKRA